MKRSFMYSKVFQDGVVVFLVVAVIASIVYLTYLNEKRWQKYKVDHHCFRSGQVRHTPQTHFYRDSNGNITGSYTTMDTDYEWICDNDKRFWR